MRHVRAVSILVLAAIALLLSACQTAAVPADTAPQAVNEVAVADSAPQVTEEVAPADSAPQATEEAAPADSDLQAADEAAPADTDPQAADEADAEADADADAEETDAPTSVRTMEEKIANAVSAAPAPISGEATVLDYPEEWPANWPDEIAPELIELRAGANGWTCIVDRPDTPGNDPMCLNETYLDVLLSQYKLVDAPDTGVGFGYMLQGGGPVGSPPHMMVFVPESNTSFDAYGTEPGPMPWIMFPETSQQHLMVLVTPPADAVAVEEDKIANAMSAGPAPIAQNATILGYPEEGRANWPAEPAPELVELRAGDNGWTCIVDIPDTPGNDPMCLNETYLDVYMSSLSLTDAPDTGVGFGYMLQGGGPVGSPPHMMVFVPESNTSFDAFGTEPGPMPWIMYPETSQQHLMVLTN